MRLAEVQNCEFETPKTWNHIENDNVLKPKPSLRTLHDLKIVGRWESTLQLNVFQKNWFHQHTKYRLFEMPVGNVAAIIAARRTRRNSKVRPTPAPYIAQKYFRSQNDFPCLNELDKSDSWKRTEMKFTKLTKLTLFKIRHFNFSFTCWQHGNMLQGECGRAKAKTSCSCRVCPEGLEYWNQHCLQNATLFRCEFSRRIPFWSCWEVKLGKIIRHILFKRWSANKTIWQHLFDTALVVLVACAWWQFKPNCAWKIRTYDTNNSGKLERWTYSGQLFSLAPDKFASNLVVEFLGSPSSLQELIFVTLIYWSTIRRDQVVKLLTDMDSSTPPGTLPSCLTMCLPFQFFCASMPFSADKISKHISTNVCICIYI